MCDDLNERSKYTFTGGSPGVAENENRPPNYFSNKTTVNNKLLKIKEKNIFFVLSTGRSGTQTIAKSLSGLAECACLHEPAPPLILESSAYRYGRLDGERLKKIILQTRQPLVNGKVYGESNQTLSLIAPVLAASFPKAKFIWLIRNGLDVVSSIFARQWYTGHSANHDSYEDCPPIEKAWIDGRIMGDLCGDVPFAKWKSMNPFARCCWYWAYTNRIIENDLRDYCSVGSHRKMKLEEMDRDLPEVVEWLGFGHVPIKKSGRHNRAHYKLYPWQKWTSEERKTFLYWCGPLMDRLYPDWRMLYQDFFNSLYDAPEGIKAPTVSDTKDPKRTHHVNSGKGELEGINIYFTPQIKTHPKISVYIPSYNQKKYLVEAIESVLAQTLKPHQVIIVDDFSNDGSQELIAKYAQKYPDLIFPIYHTKNLGVVQTRIDALNSVSGDYVTYVDGDDRFLAEKIEREFNILVGNANALIAYSNNYYINSDGQRIGIWADEEKPPQGHIFKETFARRFPKSNLFRMELINYQALKSVGFHDPDITIYEDFDMRIRLTKHFQVAFCDEPLSEIRMHNKGLSKLESKQHLASLEFIYHKNRYLLADLNESDREIVKKGFNDFVDKISLSAANQLAEELKIKKQHLDKLSHEIISASSRKDQPNRLNELGADLIFLISQPRAGSTLFQRLLAGHPEIHSTAEPWIMLHPIYALRGNGIEAEYRADLALDGLTDFLLQVPEGIELYKKALRKLGSTLYNRMLELSGKRFFLDKTPRYYHIIPELYAIFPKAKFIFLLRNPIAVLSSVLKTWFENLVNDLQVQNLIDLVKGPVYLLDGIKKLKENAIVVDYESLARSPESVMLRVCNRIGIPYYQNILDYGNNPKPKGRFGDPAGVYQHSRPVTDNIDKWLENITSPELVEFADQYLKTIGSDIVSNMGYNFEELKQRLDSQRRLCPSKSKQANLEKIRVLNEEGESLFARGEFDAALMKLQKAFNLDPNDAETNNNLGVIYHHKGEKENALTHYQKATELVPENIKFQKNLADYYDKIGQQEQAIGIYTNILKKNPADVEALLSLGLISIELERYDESFIFCQKALEMSPASIKLKDVFLKLGAKIKSSGDLNKAREIYLYYLSHDPKDDQINGAWDELKDTEKDKKIIKKIKAKKNDYIVSAIVSTYNSEEFIEECLQNLESQTIGSKLEIVVVDAASSQNEEKIVKEFQKRYSNITYIKTKSRVGIYTAWNMALKEASGRYCISASTNDILNQEACEILARYLDENPECMLVYGDTYLTKTPHESFEKNTHYDAYRWPPYSFQDHLNNCLVGPHPMWRKQLHAHIGFFNECYIADGDQEFWLRIGEKYPIAHIPFFTGLQWVADDAISRKGLLPHLEVMHIRSLYKNRFSERNEKNINLCSIIIPVFNQVKYTKQCIKALYKNTPKSLFEIIVVDNNSSDGTQEFVSGIKENIKIISNQDNLGFAKACNQGAKEASGKYLIFLNNDTVPLAGWLEEMVDTANSDVDVGIVGSKLLYPDDTIQHAGIGFVNGIPDHPFRNLPGDHPEANVSRELDMVTGACLLIKRGLFLECGGFDEQYRNGVEDIDLCLKVRLKGHKVIYNPKSTLYHHEGRTEGRFDHVNENLETFFARWADYFDDQGKFSNKAANQNILIKWEGSQFVNHSLALVNRELCIELAKHDDIELSLIPYEPDEFGLEEDPARFGLIADRLNSPLSVAADFHVRHQWPPNFTPPAEGHWIMIQPWEFGALPKDWVQPMETLVDELWVPSRHVRDVYIKSGISPDKVFIVPNGVNYDQFHPQAPKLTLATTKRFKFLFVGGTIMRKGIDVLLSAYTQAFTSADDVCLVIKDLGGESFYKGQNVTQIIEDIKKNPISPEILYITETLNNEEIAGLYTACDCLVHPYRGEGFGLPVAEAMACGLPVIVTKGGACDDFCFDENAYLIESTRRPVQLNNTVLSTPGWLLEPDKSQLIQMLKFVYQNPDKAREKAVTAARDIKKKVNWKMASERIRDRFKTLKNKPILRFANAAQEEAGKDMKSPQEIYQDIQQSMGNKKLQEVIAELEKLAESYPQFALAHNDLGVLYYTAGNKEKAHQFYEKAVLLDPENMVFQKNLADFYYVEMGRVEDALRVYVKILEADPKDVETLLITGHICVSLHQFEDAQVFYRRVLELEPLNEAAQKSLEKLDQMKPIPPELKSAEDMYRELQPLLNNRDPHKAISALEKLLESYPDYAVACNDLGVLYYHMGDKEKARHHYERAVELMSANITFQKNLADFLFVELGKVEEALQIYMDILATHPDDAETLLIVGHICVALKKFDDAKVFYERVLALEPDNEDANKNLQALIDRQSEQSPARPDSLNDVTISSAKVESTDLNTEESANQDAEHQTTVSILISLDGIQNPLKQCIERIAAHTEEPHEIILINNGATKGILKWAQNLVQDDANYQLVKCDKTCSWAQGLNQAVKGAAGDYIVLMHNDVMVPGRWLSGMQQCFRTGSGIGVVGPMTNEASGIQKVHFSDDWDLNQLESDANAFYEQNQHRRIPTKQLAPFFLMFRRTLIDRIGDFDTQLVSEQALVADFCKRSAAWGFQNFVAGDVFVYHADRHKGNQKASGDAQISAEDQKRLKENWHKTAGDPRFLKGIQMRSLLETVNELHQKGYSDQAVETLINAIGALPEEKRFYLTLAEISISLRRYQDAIDTLNEMPADAKTKMDSEEIGNLNKPRLEFPSLVAAEDLEMKTLEILGYAAEGLEDFATAKEYADRMLAIDPKSARALNLKGILAYRKKDLNAAEQFFKKSIASDPSAGESYSNLATGKLEVGQEAEAWELFEKAFILNPTDLDIATNYHTMVAARGEHKQAEAVVREATAIYPHSQKINYMLIDVLLQQGKHDEAMGKIEAAIVKFGIEDGILAASLKVREKLGPMTLQPSKKKASVSCCLIIKDEEKYLARCLASVKPIVDEMIVVDTGSADRSKDIATAFGAKVYDFEWQKDFAKARNFSLEKASGDWILILDGDEVISSLDYKHFNQIVKKRPKAPVAYTIVTRNYSALANIVGWVPNDGKYINEEAAAGWIPSIKTRLFSGKDQIWFEGAVHELVDPVVKRKGFETKQCNIPVHHYGRLDKERLTRKGEVYLEIGKKKLEEMGDDIFAVREMAIQSTTLGKNEMAIKFWQRLISLDPPELMAADAYINMATLYNRLSDFEQALLVAKKAVAKAPHIKESLYNYALAELHIGNAQATTKVLEELVNRMPDYPPAHFILAAAYFCIAEKKKGFKIIGELKATPLGPNLVYPVFELAESLIKAQQNEYALLLLGAAIECDIVNKQILELFNKCIQMRVTTKNSLEHPRPLSPDRQAINFENLPQ